MRAAVQSHAVFFAQVSPPAAVTRKHHRDVLNAIKAHEPDKAAKAVSDYLFKAQEMLSALFPSRSKNGAAPTDGKGPAGK